MRGDSASATAMSPFMIGMTPDLTAFRNALALACLDVVPSASAAPTSPSAVPARS